MAENAGEDSSRTREEIRGAVDGDAKLVFRTGASRGRVLVIEKDRLSIGRDGQADIVIADDLVSARHAVLSSDPDDPSHYWIRDSGSKNGTFLNGRRLDRPVLLRDGDVFCLARAGPEIQLTYGEPSLPSLVATTTAKFVRARSIESAVREIFPSRKGVGLVSASGVREIVDCRLEDHTRRVRRRALLVFVASLVILGAGGVAWLRSLVNSPDVRLVVQLHPIYGNVFRSYKDHPVGRIEIINEGNVTLEDIQVEFDLYSTVRGERRELLLERFVRVVSEVSPASSRGVEVTPAISNEILSSTDQDVTAEVRLSIGDEVLASRTQALLVYGRHVFSWKNPERIAALIYTEDPLVLSFVNAVWRARPALSGDEFPPRNVTSAIGLLTALAERGLRYLDDPQTPSSVAADSTVHDRIKLPGETLDDGTGDCDDLSVLCCSLLKAVGVSTAFLVDDDHVLFMFDSGVASTTPEDSPFAPESVVAWRGRLWIPVETTKLTESSAGFAAAWAAAWKYKEAVEGEKVEIVDIQSAWRDYRPLPPEAQPRFGSSEQLREWVREDLSEKISAALEEIRGDYLERILKSKVERIREELDGPEREQQIGLVLARAGLYSQARKVLEQAIFGGPMPSRREGVLAWKEEVRLDTAALLSDLALSIALGAGGDDSAAQLGLAAACFELALRGVPDDFPEKAEMMLQLSLILRERGDLQEAGVWSAAAFRLDPSVRRTYLDLTRRRGPVAGRRQRVNAYLKRAL